MTRRSPRWRQQRPFSSHTMRTFWTLLSGRVVMPFESGAAEAAVTNNALTPNAIQIANFFIMFSG
jgi:hypothetical protein